MFLTETQRSLVTMSLRYAGEHYKENASAMEEAKQKHLRDIFLAQAKDVESIADQIENSFSVEIVPSNEVE